MQNALGRYARTLEESEKSFRRLRRRRGRESFLAAAMGAGVTGDGIAEMLNGGSAASSESSSTLRKAS